MTVIDLGEDFAPVDLGTERTWTVDRRWWHAAKVCIVLAVAAITLVASLPPSTPPLRLVAHLSVGVNATLMVIDSEAIVVDFRQGRNIATAYALPGGRVRWTSPIAIFGPEAGVTAVGHTLLVTRRDPGPLGSFTQALDADTGQELWRRAADLRDVLAGGDVVLDAVRFGIGVNRDDLQRVDARTGAMRWSLSVPRDCDQATVGDAAGDPPDSFIVLCGRSLTAYDLATGRTRATRTVSLGSTTSPPAPGATNRIFGSEMTVFDNLVLITHDNIPTATIDAYRESDLSPLWSGLGITGSDSIGPCGQQVCYYTAARASILDPATGRVLPDAPVPPEDPPTPGTQGLNSLIGYVGQLTTLVLVPAGQTPAPPLVDAISRFTVDAPAGLAISMPDAASGRTWIAVQRTTAGGHPTIVALQLLRGVRADSCASVAGYLACATGGNALSIWALPSVP